MLRFVHLFWPFGYIDVHPSFYQHPLLLKNGEPGHPPSIPTPFYSGNESIQEAAFHRHEQTSWRPNISILLILFVKVALFISIAIQMIMFFNMYSVDACIVGMHLSVHRVRYILDFGIVIDYFIFLWLSSILIQTIRRTRMSTMNAST